MKPTDILAAGLLSAFGITGIFLFLACLAGCSNRSDYWIVLAADANSYRPEMTWDEVRENGYNKPYTLRVFDSNGQPVPLFRFGHDDGSIRALEDSLLHISTPIIVTKNHQRLCLVVLDKTNEIGRAQVDMRHLKALAGERSRYVFPITLPEN